MRARVDVAGGRGRRRSRRGGPGTVLICYDGSACSGAAIAEAGRELGPGRQALVLTVWEPFVVTGFALSPAAVAGAADEELRREAEGVAERGTELARRAGFEAEPLVELGAPVWHRIAEVADERAADLIVLGSHGRSGLRYLLLGSVATAVVQHAGRPVLIAPDASAPGRPAASASARRAPESFDQVIDTRRSPMKSLAAVLAIPVIALVLAGCGSGGGASATTASTSSSGAGYGAGSESSTATQAAAGSGPEVSAKPVSGVGTVLVDAQGMTLYMFAPDKQHEVTCTGSCAAVWPPLKVEAGEKPVASGPVKAGLLGSDPNPEGGEVVTYDGWPLYTYAGDTKPGVAAGQALNLNGGYWYVITPAGKVVKE